MQQVGINTDQGLGGPHSAIRFVCSLPEMESLKHVLRFLHLKSYLALYWVKDKMNKNVAWFVPYLKKQNGAHPRYGR